MLVISRKTEEFLQIGDNIIVKIIKSSNGSVKIGIEAPGDVRVMRGELQENAQALPKTRPTSRWGTQPDRSESERTRIAEAV